MIDITRFDLESCALTLLKQVRQNRLDAEVDAIEQEFQAHIPDVASLTSQLWEDMFDMLVGAHQPMPRIEDLLCHGTLDTTVTCPALHAAIAASAQQISELLEDTERTRQTQSADDVTHDHLRSNYDL